MMLRNTTVKLKNIGPLNANADKANATSTNRIERIDWRKFIQSAYSMAFIGHSPLSSGTA